ncbi:MAG: SDR family oxidoreductase [Acidimicrobiales bacterium]|jgi:NADP-dependent 3-hydroxy acid dehydrogenase YdfG|nr:SDR family oxidoreductase [Acidimicrobiales bacterium]
MTDVLDGKRILVVGASSGIGAAVARLAAARGAHVAVTARSEERLAGLVEAHGVRLALAGDVRDEASIASVVDAAVEGLGGLDAVVNSVGMSPLLPMVDATQADWHKVFDTNVIGAALVATAVAPHLVASGGQLVVLSSKAVRRPFPDLALYTTSKFALDGLMKCLPLEFPGLLVTRVVVGNTGDTEFASSWDPETLGAATERWLASGVLGSEGIMSPDDVAATVLHVLESPAHIDDVAVIDRPPR